MRRRWLITIAVAAISGGVAAVVYGGIAGVGVWSRAPVADAPRGAALHAASERTRSAPEVPAARSELRFAAPRAAEVLAAVTRDQLAAVAAEPAGAVASPRLGVTAGMRRLGESPEFIDFVERSRLDETQQRTLARVLALYHENERNLKATVSDPEQLASLQRQLLHDTRVQLRGRLALSADDGQELEASGLLPTPAAEAPEDLSATERGPT